jgi:hypothetical protein
VHANRNPRRNAQLYHATPTLADQCRARGDLQHSGLILKLTTDRVRTAVPDPAEFRRGVVLVGRDRLAD